MAKTTSKPAAGKPAATTSKTASKLAANSPAEPSTGTKLSAFSDLRKDQTLRQNMDKARKGSVSQDYEGPDADIVCVFVRINEGVKDGIPWRTVEFKVDEEGEFKGKRVSKYFSFADTQWKTKAEICGDFFQCFIDMGLDTETLSDEDLAAALAEIAESKVQFLIKAKRSKSGFLNFYIQERLDTVSDDQDDAAEAASDDDTVLPSEWDGHEVGLKTKTGKGPKKTEKIIQVWVANPNDEAGTIDLVDEKGAVIVEGIALVSDDIVWPD